MCPVQYGDVVCQECCFVCTEVKLMFLRIIVYSVLCPSLVFVIIQNICYVQKYEVWSKAIDQTDVLYCIVLYCIVMIGAFISIFSNRLKAPHGDESFEACGQWALLSVQIITLLRVTITSWLTACRTYSFSPHLSWTVSLRVTYFGTYSILPIAELNCFGVTITSGLYTSYRTHSLWPHLSWTVSLRVTYFGTDFLS